MEKNIEKELTLSDISREFHYSKNYIIRIFNEEFGMSPIQYVNEVRMRRALYMLETTSRPVGESRSECGYTNYPYFYKRFIQKTGIPPLKWRRQMQATPSHE